MVPHVLGVGYAYNEYEVTAGRWKEFEIEFDYADNIKQAAAMLSFKEYICVAICSDVIPQDDLDILRQKRAVPIIVVPPSYSEEQRYACVHFGAAQYLHTYNHPMVEASNPVPTPLLGHRCRSSQEITGSPTPFSTSNHYLWICPRASFSLSNPNIAA